ncbi:MAG: hypothetical protein GEV07_25145 [Streptosporangiales bacterium]|nr:hypothetical protein [Streptosporangiales bacterium]
MSDNDQQEPGQDQPGPDQPHGEKPSGHEQLGERKVPWRTESIPRRRAVRETSLARRKMPPGPTARPTPAPSAPAAPLAPAGVESHGADAVKHAEPGGHAAGAVLHTTPLWRLLGVVLAFGALGLAGWGLNLAGHIDDAATVIGAALVFTIGFWAKRQRGRLAERLGLFHRIGAAIIDSHDEIQHWVQRRTLLAGVCVATGYGIGIALVKNAVKATLGWLASPWLAAALGCAVGAAVIAPDLWRGLRHSVKGTTST